MDMLIAILLWLGSFQPDGQYTTAEMAYELEEHAAEVATIMNSPSLQQQVWDSCGTTVPRVIVIGEGN